MSEITCNFCGKARREVRTMVAGTDAYICNECVGLCVYIIGGDPEPLGTVGVSCCPEQEVGT